jgi:hypothetical protein|tara:strand:+ start:344 stop:568 length:225 start_codon:yes stop_codon:yes gene_type:complete
MAIKKPNNAASAYGGSNTLINPRRAVIYTKKIGHYLPAGPTTKSNQGLLQHGISNFDNLVLPDVKEKSLLHVRY